MGVVQVRLPEELQEVIDRQVAEGRAVDVDAYLTEAARRYAEDLEFEDDIISEAKAGIADIEAGHKLVATRDDLVAMEKGVMNRMRERLADNQG